MITFIRAFTLLAIFLTLPAIAICWNHLPKNHWNAPVPSSPVPSSPASETETSQFFWQSPSESADSASVFVPEPISPVLPPPAVPAAASDATAFPSPHTAPVPGMTVQQVSWAHPQPAPPQATLPRDYESLQRHLDALGVRFYELKKWGDRGELFRFSCLVAPSGPHVYEKHFQAIHADELTAIQTVIAEIERWQNGR